MLIATLVLGFVIMGILYFVFAVWSDPLVRLEVMAARNPDSLSGPGVIIKLPEKASPEAVAKYAFPGCSIEEVRKVEGDRTAVLIESLQGEKILLLQYEINFGWLVETRDPE
jgi:hypothetical protein